MLYPVAAAVLLSSAMALQAIITGVGVLLMFEAYLQTIDSPLWLAFNQFNPFAHLSRSWKWLGGTCCILSGILANLLMRIGYGDIVPGG